MVAKEEYHARSLDPKQSIARTVRLFKQSNTSREKTVLLARCSDRATDVLVIITFDLIVVFMVGC